MSKLAMSIPYIIAMIAFLATYVVMMWLTGPYASMIVAPVLGLVIAIVVFLFANYILERKSHSHD